MGGGGSGGGGRNGGGGGRRRGGEGGWREVGVWEGVGVEVEGGVVRGGEGCECGREGEVGGWNRSERSGFKVGQPSR